MTLGVCEQGRLAAARGHLFRAVLLVALVALGACPPPLLVEPPVVPTAHTQVEPDEESLPPPQPGWRYHPSAMREVREGARLEDRSWLLLGQGGERWLTEPLPEGVARPETKNRSYWAEASSYRGPEPLILLAKVARRWLFVGESGAVYASNTPIGPLRLLATAPEPFLDVAKAGDGLAAVNALGELYRFRFSESSWSRVAALPWHIFELAAGSEGQLLGLALPEKLLVSADGANSFSPLAGAPIGAYQLAQAGSGAVLVRAAAGNHLWASKANKLRAAGSAKERSLPTDGKLALRARRGPSADALVDSRAALSGLRYYEAREDVDALDCEGEPCADTGRRTWFLLAGRIDHSLQRKPLPWAGDCDSVRLAASHKKLVAACLKPSSGTSEVQLHRSADEGASWKAVGQLRTADVMALVIAVAPDGTALLFGACPAKGKSCATGSPLRLDTSDQLQLIEAAGLDGAASNPAFSLDGNMAYFVGRRVKNNALALFVSEDGGQLFTAQRVAAPKGKPHAFYSAWGRADAEQVSLHPGTNGELGIALRNGDKAHYAVANLEGEIQQLARLDPETVAVAGSGRSILATSTVYSRLGLQQVALELSTNGGVSFQPLPLPFSLGRDELDEGLGVACSSVACVIGARMTRLSWLSTADSHRVSEAHLRLDNPGNTPVVRTSIVCNFDDKHEWATIDGLEWPAGPESYELFRGNNAWAVLRHHRGSGRVVVSSASSKPARNKLKEIELLAAEPNKGGWSYFLAKQNEGFVALRAPIAAASTELEMAWLDDVRGVIGKGRLKKIAAYQPTERTPGPRSYLLPGLVSITPAGLFIQPHDSSNELRLVDRRGKTTANYALIDWQADQLYSKFEATVVDGQALGIAAQGRQPGRTEIIRAALLGKTAQPSSPTSLTVALQRDSDPRAETRWSQRGGQLGVSVHFVDQSSERALAYFIPINKNGQLGPAEPLATQQEIGDAPRACSTKELKTTRFVAPFLLGTRHPVIVNGLGEGLMTTEAIVHGSKDSPCVQGWLAQTLHQDVPEWSMRAVIPANLKRAWLLRKSKTHLALDYRPMSCSYSPATPFPPWVSGFERTTRMSP